MMPFMPWPHLPSRNKFFLCLMTGYKNVLTPKEVEIKISSVLNVSNSISKPEEFNLKDNEVFVDNKEQY